MLDARGASDTHDGRGRLIERAGNLPMTFGWDTMGHLRSTTTAGATTRYRYDPAGRLIAIDNPGTAEDEYFVYRNGLEPVAWTRGDVHQYYVYASMPHVPDLIYEDSDADPEIDAIYRVITDERGSVRSVLRLGETIEVAQMVEYTAWGEPTYLHGDAHIQPFGFAGATWLPQARLWHMGAREYDPRLGRWISKDPIRFAGGTNLYVYCEGDPVNCIDPTGEWVWWVVAGVAALLLLDDDQYGNSPANSYPVGLGLAGDVYHRSAPYNATGEVLAQFYSMRPEGGVFQDSPLCVNDGEDVRNAEHYWYARDSVERFPPIIRQAVGLVGGPVLVWGHAALKVVTHDPSRPTDDEVRMGILGAIDGANPFAAGPTGWERGRYR